MNSSPLFLRLTVLSLSIVLCLPQTTEGFNDNAHIRLSRRAVQSDVSNLDNFLMTVLGFEFPSGVAQQLKAGEKGAVEGLIAEVGAVDEDWGTRPVHHFHNPTKAWNQGCKLGVRLDSWERIHVEDFYASSAAHRSA